MNARAAFSASNMRVLVFLSLLFLITRVALILWGYDSLYHPDELEQGSIALAILNGIQAPLINYQVDTYSGGTLIYGLAAIPFLYFIGVTLFSLKMLSLSTALVTFIMAVLMVNRFWGFKASLYAALLWIFSPPGLSLTQLTALGAHECLLPPIAFCYSFFLLYANKKYGSLTHALTGFLAGFAFYFSYINLIALSACFWTATRHHYPTQTNPFRSLFFFVAGFSLGASPWLFYNLPHGFAGVRFLVQSSIFPALSLETFANALHRLAFFFLRDLPNGLLYPHLFSTQPFILNFACFLGAAGVLLWDLRHPAPGKSPNGTGVDAGRALTYFCRTYLVIYPFFFIFSNYRVYGGVGSTAPWEFRYLVPYYGFALLYFAAALTRLAFQKTILILAVALGLSSQIATVWGKPFGQVFHQLAFQVNPNPSPYQHPPLKKFRDLADFQKTIRFLEQKKNAWFQIKEIAHNSNLWDLADPAAVIASLLKLNSETHRRYFFRRWLVARPLDYHSPEATDQLESLVRLSPPAYRRDLILGAGLALNFGEFDSLSEAVDFIETLDLEDKTMLYFSLGRFLFWQMRSDILSKEEWPEVFQFTQDLEKERRSWLIRGMGSLIYTPFRHQDSLSLNLRIFPPSLLSETRNDLEWGIGWNLGERYWGTPEKSLEMLEQLAPAMRENALQGFRFFSA